MFKPKAAAGLGALALALAASTGPASASTLNPPPGYRIIGASGWEFTFQPSAPPAQSAPTQSLSAPAVGSAANPVGAGHWILMANGGVVNQGGATWYGSPASQFPSGVPSTPVAIAATPDGKGYWVLSKAGNVWNYGDATWYGSPYGKTSSPMTSITATSTGYLVVDDYGNVFNYNTSWCGSPISEGKASGGYVSIAAAAGGGYYVGSSYGGIFNFPYSANVGQGCPSSILPWYGSAAAAHETLPAPVVAIQVARSTTGYRQMLQNGNVQSYGGATWNGAVPSQGWSTNAIGFLQGA